MKVVERDFVLLTGVPDEVELENCEVVIHKASVSYPTASGPVTLGYDDGPGGKDEVEIVAGEARFTEPDGGAILERRKE